MRHALRTACLIAAAGILASNAHAQNIDTRVVDSYVYGGSGTYGQSFTVGSLTRLNSFSFWVDANDAQGGGVGPYQFYTQLYQWTGTAIVGSSLYTSSTQTAVCCSNTVPPRFDFNVGAIDLIGGSQYLAVVARTTPGGLKVGYARGATGFADNYAGGEFVGGLSNDPGTTSFFPIQFAPGNDLMFVAQFERATTIAPEPSTFALFGTGIIALGVLRRRRRA